MSSYFITIDVDPEDLAKLRMVPPGSTGNFVHTPSLLRVAVTGEDDVTWISRYPFALEFKVEPPIDQVTVSGTYRESIPQLGGGPGYSTGPRPVDQGASGTFHYAVAVYKDNTVFIDAACGGVSVN